MQFDSYFPARVSIIFPSQWAANPRNDVLADAVLKLVLKAQELDLPEEQVPDISTAQPDHRHFKVS